MALFATDWRPSKKQLRNFGLIAAFLAAGVGILLFSRGSLAGVALGGLVRWIVASAFLAVGALCLVLALVVPRSLRPTYVIINAVTLPIGLVLSFVVLSGLFYLLFTPMSLVFRLLGRDALQRKLDPDADSYWMPCEKQRDVGGYFRQF